MCLEGYWWEQRGDLGEDGEDIFFVRPLLWSDAGLAKLDDDSIEVVLNVEVLLMGDKG